MYIISLSKHLYSQGFILGGKLLEALRHTSFVECISEHLETRLLAAARAFGTRRSLHRCTNFWIWAYAHRRGVVGHLFSANRVRHHDPTSEAPECRPWGLNGPWEVLQRAEG